MPGPSKSPANDYCPKLQGEIMFMGSLRVWYTQSFAGLKQMFSVFARSLRK